jgi:hypothetical protein
MRLNTTTTTTTNIRMYGEICSLFVNFILFSEEWNTAMSRGVIVALYKLWKHLESFSECSMVEWQNGVLNVNRCVRSVIFGFSCVKQVEVWWW